MNPYTEADPAPEQPWTETSSPGIRKLALDACRAAIRAAQEPAQARTDKAAPQ